MHKKQLLPLRVIVRHNIQVIPEGEEKLSEISEFSNLP